MKKILALALCLITLIACTVLPTHAATANVKVSLSKTTADRGESVTLTVSLQNGDVAKSVMITPSYDSSVLEYVSGNWLIDGSLKDIRQDGYAVLATSAATVFSGNVLSWTFKVRDGAEYGNTSLSCAVVLKNGTATLSTDTPASVSLKIACSHSYGSWQKHNADRHKRVCSKCNAEDFAAHTWDSGTVTKQPTEAQAGERKYTCTLCKETKTEVIPKTDHKHTYASSWKSDKNNHWQECTCGDKTKIAAHTADSGKVTIKVTCSEDGVKTFSCTVCGIAIREEVIPAAGHTFGAWKVTKAPTVTETGLMERVCQCGEKETKIIEKSAEDVTDNDSEASVTPEDTTALPEGTTLVVKDVTDTVKGEELSEITNAVKELYPNNELLKLYDISLQFENAAVQPNGTVRVELPAPELDNGKDGNSLKVVYIDTDGIAHDISAEYKEGKLVFSAENLGNYAVVYDRGNTGSDTTGNTDVTTDTNTGTDAPQPKDNNSVLIWIVVLAGVIIFVFFIILFLKRRKKDDEEDNTAETP